jgi:hypothetical protein
MSRKPVIDNPSTLLQEDINELFEQKEEGEFEIIFSVLNLILMKNERNTDMIDLFNTLGMSNFIKTLHLFDGRTIQFTTSDKFTDGLILSIVYYLREIEHIRDWEKVQEYFGSFKLDRLSLALKIHNLNDFTKQKIHEQFKRMKKDEK